MKVEDAIGAQLDWMVAKCEAVALVLAPFTGAKNFVILGQNMKPTSSTYTPTTSWAQGGPILEREKIELEWAGHGGDSDWNAQITADSEFYGPTPLIAAMRCYVSSRLGDEVDVPEELL